MVARATEKESTEILARLGCESGLILDDESAPGRFGLGKLPNGLASRKFLKLASEASQEVLAGVAVNGQKINQ